MQHSQTCTWLPRSLAALARPAPLPRSVRRSPTDRRSTVRPPFAAELTRGPPAQCCLLLRPPPKPQSHQRIPSRALSIDEKHQAASNPTGAMWRWGCVWDCQRCPRSMYVSYAPRGDQQNDGIGTVMRTSATPLIRTTCTGGGLIFKDHG
ncbi:hypothetical protein DFJ73DRAFT_811931 [Zopfochytrium polystomum]|nr:hypothetical protein DFJ73DRAFT_811931 [Zopfochytrium polystomum]